MCWLPFIFLVLFMARSRIEGFELITAIRAWSILCDWSVKILCCPSLLSSLYPNIGIWNDNFKGRGSLLYGTVRNTCFCMLAVLWYWYSFFFTRNVLMLITAIYLWNMISSDCQQSKCLCVGHSRSLASGYFRLWDQLQASFDWYVCDHIKSLFFFS